MSEFGNVFKGLSDLNHITQNISLHGQISHKMQPRKAEKCYFLMLFAYKENIKSFCLKVFTKQSKTFIHTLKTLADSFDTFCAKKS